MAALWVADSSWSYQGTKQNIKKEKLGNEVSIEGFEKLHIFLKI